MNTPLMTRAEAVHTTARMPHCEHPDLVDTRDIVDVVPRSLEQDAARIHYGRLSIQTADLRRMGDEVEGNGEFIDEQVR